MTAEHTDAARAEEPLPEHAVLGAYRLVQRLGEGGMGVVHLALDRHGRAVALKVLRPHVAHDPDARQRLAREVDTLSRVRSPRVAPVIDADVEGERPFIVTRYVPGDPLDTVIDRTGPLGPGELHRLGGGLVEALEVIHAADVIHRDLKPGNVLIVDGDPVVIDFGIAHVADDVRLTMTGLVMGTPGYLAPEVIEGAPVSRATDWWGWASTLTYAASGRPPFGRGPMDAVLGRVTRGEPDLAGVDRRIAPLLYAALAPDPAARPRADEVVTALERYAHGGDVTEVVDLRRGRIPERTEALSSAGAGAAATARLAQPATALQPAQAPGAEPPGPQPMPVLAGEWQPAAGVAARGQQVVPGHPGQQSQQALQQPRPVPQQPMRPPQQPGQGWPAADPRIGLASRSGVIAAMLTVVVALAAVAPVVAGLGLLVWMVLARTVDASMTGLVLRRHEHGRRRSDVPLAVVSSPWRLVVGLVASVLGAIMPMVVAVTGVFSAALAFSAVQGGAVEPASFLPLSVGGLLGSLMAWWGPGGAGLRRGTRSIVRALTPGRAAAATLAVVCLGAAVAALLVRVPTGEPTWAPLQSGRPTWSGVTLP